jgi:hypothetical protein
MTWVTMTWQESSLIWLAGALMLLSIICIIAAVRKAERDSKSLERFEARVGRDYYRDVKGLTK